MLYYIVYPLAGYGILYPQLKYQHNIKPWVCHRPFNIELYNCIDMIKPVTNNTWNKYHQIMSIIIIQMLNCTQSENSLLLLPSMLFLCFSDELLILRRGLLVDYHIGLRIHGNDLSNRHFSIVGPHVQKRCHWTFQSFAECQGRWTISAKHYTGQFEHWETAS